MKKFFIFTFVFVFFVLGNTKVFASDWIVEKEISSTSNTITSIDKFDDYIMSAGGDGEILSSSNSGVTWTESAPFPSIMFDVSVFNNETAITVGEYGMIYKTTDFGSTWTNFSSGTTEGLHSIYMNGANGWIVGDNGTVLYTTDSGNSWSTKSISTTEDLNSIFFFVSFVTSI